MLIQAMPRGGDAWQEIRSRDLQVGSIVKITEDSFFPADILLLQTSLPKGIAYVETKNLDGETNLKHKVAPKALFDLFKDDIDMIENLRGVV